MQGMYSRRVLGASGMYVRIAQCTFAWYASIPGLAEWRGFRHIQRMGGSNSVLVAQAKAAGIKPTDARGLARVWTRSAIATIQGIMRSADVPANVRLAAAQELLNRAHGRPAQALIHMSAGDDRPAALDVLGELFGLEAQTPTIIDADPINVAIQARAAPVYAAGMWLRGMSS